MQLPGTYFTTIGGLIKTVTQGPSTERVLVIGTALDGPLNGPVVITDGIQAEQVFGPATYTKGYKNPVTGLEDNKPAGATLPLAIQQLLSAGATNIVVCRATGTIAKNEAAFGSKLEIVAQNPGRIYNEVSVVTTVSSGALTLTINQPTVKGGNVAITFGTDATIEDVISKVNNEPRNTTVYFEGSTFPAYLTDLASSLGAATEAVSSTVAGTNGTLARGEDYGPEVATGLNGYASMLTAADTGTFARLYGENVAFNLAVLTGIHGDDQVVEGADATKTSIAVDFAAFIDQCFSAITPCHGVVAVRPHGLRQVEDVIAYCNNNLLATAVGFYDETRRWIKFGPFMYNGIKRSDPIAGTLDIGKHLSVVAGPDVVCTDPVLGRYSTTPHVLYAGFLSTLPPEQGANNARLPGAIGYGKPFPSRYTQKLVDGVGHDDNVDLSGKGAYVVLTQDKNNYGGPLVIADDPTAAPRNDFFRQYSLVHLTNSIHRQLSDELSRFLGKPSSAATLATMEAAARNVMDGFVQSGGLRGPEGQGYSIQLTMRGTDAAVGLVRCWVEIAAAAAIRRIQLVVTVRQPAA